MVRPLVACEGGSFYSIRIRLGYRLLAHAGFGGASAYVLAVGNLCVCRYMISAAEGGSSPLQRCCECMQKNYKARLN